MTITKNMMKICAAFTGFLFLSVSCALAGDALSQMRPRLEADLNAYAQATIRQDVDQIISFTHPATFKTLSKEKMASILRNIFTSGKAPVIKEIKFTKIGNIHPFSKGYFSVVTYQISMSLRRPGDSSPKLDKMLISMIKDEFGEDTQVIVDEKNFQMSIVRNNVKLFAIKNTAPKETGWKVIADDQLRTLKASDDLPADLLQKLTQTTN